MLKHRPRLTGPVCFADLFVARCGGPCAGDLEARGGVLCASCGVLVPLLRHHADHTKRSMALVIGVLRGMLLSIAAWARSLRHAHHSPPFTSPTTSSSASSSPSSAWLLVRCCSEVARAYEAVSEHRASCSKYCAHMLADYIAYVAVPMAAAQRQVGARIARHGWHAHGAKCVTTVSVDRTLDTAAAAAAVRRVSPIRRVESHSPRWCSGRLHQSQPVEDCKDRRGRVMW